MPAGRFLGAAVGEPLGGQGDAAGLLVRKGFDHGPSEHGRTAGDKLPGRALLTDEVTMGGQGGRAVGGDLA